MCTGIAHVPQQICILVVHPSLVPAKTNDHRGNVHAQQDLAASADQVHAPRFNARDANGLKTLQQRANHWPEDGSVLDGVVREEDKRT
eukprot:6438899-Amphidinium_carterae.1